MNSGAALALLFERGRLTRGELRAATGLSKPTVSEVMRRLVAADLAIVDGQRRGGPGPSTEVYAVNPDAAHVAAVSVRQTGGGPWLAAARADLTGAVRGRLDRPVDLRAGDPVALIAAGVEELFAGRADANRLTQVCLGVPGAFDPVRRVVHHVDLPGFDAVGLADALAARLGVPVELDNDVNLAAVAERNRGCAVEASGFALLWLGEGVGLGIDLGGTLLRGARGGAGELSYLPTLPGSTGPGPRSRRLQELAGGAAVRILAAQYIRAEPASDSAMGTGPGYTAGPGTSVPAGHDSTVDVIVVAMIEPAFLAALAERVAFGLAAVVAVLDPELLVLAGPIGRIGGAPLAEAVRAALSRLIPLAGTVAPLAVAVTTVDGDPVVAGGLDAALAAARRRLVAALHDPDR